MHKNNSVNIEKLTEEQDAIINGSERLIVVSAGPGSGKTYTLIKKINRELLDIDEYLSVIACSFTREAANQLRDKLAKKTDVRSSFIGTIDSLVLTIIIDPFKNRILNFYNIPSKLSKLKITMPPQNSTANIITRGGLKHSSVNNYSKYWFENFSKGSYEISFPTYLLAGKLLEKMAELSEYLDSKYTAIYIDEAQDLNEFQHYFIDNLIKNTNLKCIMIGDKNQSIYEFRGSRPDYFYRLKDNDYKEYRITMSLRCHQCIINFSNKIVDGNLSIVECNDERVKFKNISIDELKMDGEQNEQVYILTETRLMAVKIYEELYKNGVDFIYTTRIVINDTFFMENYIEILEYILLFYYNIDNDNPKNIISIIVFSEFLSNFTYKMNNLITQLKIQNDTVIQYVKKVFNLLNYQISQSVYDDIEEQLEKKVIRNHYYKDDNKNRIMTIHSAKGLEADKVYVVLEKEQKTISEEYKRKLFVASTRARDYLYFHFTDDIFLENSNIVNYLKKCL